MTSPQRDPKFKDELKKLNEELLNVIETHNKKSPYHDFTMPVQDYIKELASLKDKYPLKKAEPAPAFSFGQPTTQTATTTTTTTFANNRLFSIPTNPTNPAPTLTFSTTTTASATPFGITTPAPTPFSTTTAANTTPFSTTTTSTTPFSFTAATTTPFSTTTATTTTPFSTPFSFTGSLFGASSNNNNTTTTTTAPANTTITSSSAQQPDDSQNKTNATDTTTNADGDEAEGGEEESQPPQPNVDKFEETNVKYEVRTKLYERIVKTGQPSEVKLIGCGTLFVKELDTPKKLHLIVRQDPDLRRVLLNQIITEQVPVSLRPKALQLLVPNSEGQTTIYFAKVKDDNIAKKLLEVLNSVKDA